MTEELPIKLEKISKKLWPRKIYVKAKETHPILGSIFLGTWSVFWTILAILLNVAFFLIIVVTIALVLAAVFGDSSFDPGFSSFSFSSDKKKENKR